MKNRWLVLSLLLVSALLLAACQPAAEPTEEVVEETEAPVATEEPEVEETEAPVATEEPTEAPTEEATAEPTEAAAEIDCMGAAAGDEVSMIYQWADVEEEQFMEILQPLVDACGIVLAPESTRDPAIVDTRVQSGNPPDILMGYARQAEQYQDVLVPMTDLGANLDNYAEFWQAPGTVDGTVYALPVKADIKTIIWYSPATFEAFGYEVPETWEDLDALVEQMVADGNVPWSMGLESGDATGWTGSDFIQDILLVTQGPDYVNSIMTGEIPYNDAGVLEAYEIYGAWASDPAYTVGGAEGTLSTAFGDALLLPFSDPPEAMMVKQSGFTGAEVKAAFPELEYGVDYDFFGVPGAQGVQGGADWMLAFSDEPAVAAVVAYITSEAGGQGWAEVGFGLTPNAAGTGAYSDPQLGKLGDILAGAEGFTTDIGDTIPGGFGSAEWSVIVEYLNGGDLQTLLDQATEVQTEALATP